MNDKNKIDSHKLTLHPNRVSKWLSANDNWSKIQKIYPIYVEIAPIGACNHRCTFCSVDYLGYETISQDKDLLILRLKEMAEKGVKSIMFAGEGEPALWKPLPEVMERASKFGIDMAMTTNMVPFTSKNTEQFVANSSWIKVSINAGTEEGYADIHKTKSSDFNLVLKNIERAVNIKKNKGYKCTLGAQMVLLPENKDQVVRLAKILKNIGIDYLVVKPYTQSLYGISKKYIDLKYDDMMHLENNLNKIKSSSFDIIFRGHTMQKLNEERQPYDKCNATPVFWSYIMADGSVYSCGAFLGNKDFLLGNINKTSFSNIWEGKERKHNYLYVNNFLSIKNCRKNCRMDEVNRYLWELKNPSSHHNFI
ncbi:radical SAM protein [bacterium]|jgi:GTP 3',8-cyclase|nr:radical SAM protein [bacterium]